jgi:DNA-binding Lrp family transcriptional regulator
MDDIDKSIIRTLQENDRTPLSVIGKQLDIGTSTVHFRIKRLMAQGIIKGFHANVDPEAVGLRTQAWLGLSVDPLRIDEVAKALSVYDEVQLVSTSSGDHDIVVQIIARDDKDLWKFINENIKTMPGVEKHFHVSSFLDVYKNTQMVNVK